MKKTITLFALVLLTTLTGCETKTTIKGTDTTEKPATPEATKNEVIALMDSFHNALKNKKADDMKNLLDINGLYCGTDPTEMYNRDAYASKMAETLNHPDLGTVAYTVDLRQIMIDESGTSATIMEQYKMDLFSPEIPWRLVSHAVKKDGTWIINFLSFSLVPTNKQQELINDAVYIKG
jgi:SnoaL-like domain